MDNLLDSFRDFIYARLDRLATSGRFQAHCRHYAKLFCNDAYEGDDRRVLETFVQFYVEEGSLTLSLLGDAKVDRTDPILEVGGATGFVYAYLKSSGYNVFSLEPSESGFGGSYETGSEVLGLLDVDREHWYPYPASQAGRIGHQFKVIFSNNVLEHIPDLPGAFAGLRDVLAPEGVMVHNTVNYLFPYEAHLKMPLVPLFPELTALLCPRLRTSELWKGLNFITTFQIARVCRACDLRVTWDRRALLRTLLRLEDDKEFRRRQHFFVPIYRLLKASRLLYLMPLIPVCFTTPVRFKATRADRQAH